MDQTSTKVKIFALPFGGGSRYSYRPLEHLVSGNFEWETLELPGRGARMTEPLLMDIHAMADDLFRQIWRRLHHADYLLYGHSMGTLLAYELTKRLLGTGLPKPVCLFLTGRGAPGATNERKIADYEPAAFWHEVELLGGLPPEILADIGMREFFEPILRADFKAIEEYAYQAPAQPLPVPIFIRYGEEEDIPSSDINEWQKETAFALNAHAQPGNHFFIYEHPENLIMQIKKAYWTAKTRRVPDLWRARVQAPVTYARK